MSKVISIPQNIKQTGLTLSDITQNYAIRDWAAGTGQAKVSKMWRISETGSKGIATIDDRYLVALTTKFGKAGDAVTIQLENGVKIPAIMADAKGSDAHSPWGHKKPSGKISVVEWEALRYPSSVNLGKWEGKRVASITNHGQYSKGKKINDDTGGGAVQTFLDCLRSHLGKEGHDWVCKKTGISYSTPWCAATLCAAAIETGFAGRVMPKKVYFAPGNSGFGGQVINKYGGKKIKVGEPPQPGDIFVTTRHTGVVEKVKGDTLWIIDGNGDTYDNTTSTIARQKGKYSMSNGKSKFGGDAIQFYARPNWDEVGGAGVLSDSDGGGGGGGPLYSTRSTRADATLRQVGYMSKDGKISTKTSKDTDVELSVINYTSLMYGLNAMYGTGGDDSKAGGGDALGVSGIKNKTARSIAEFLSNKGLNNAAIAGVLGNMQQESNFKLGASNGTHFGLCQWGGGRFTNLKKTAGAAWNTNLEGQLKHLWNELTGSYKSTLNALKKVKDNESGVKEAARIFEEKYEVSGGSALENRIKYALEFYKQMGEGVGDFAWPCKNKIVTSLFGQRNFSGGSKWHAGIDIGAGYGEPIYAVNSGKVVSAGYVGGYGNLVMIRHNSDLYSFYAHLTTIKVRKGDTVKRKQVVGSAGSTGGNYAVHLHFGVSSNESTAYSSGIDPLKYFKRKTIKYTIAGEAKSEHVGEVGEKYINT